MLVALPDRIPVHLVDFGHLVEPSTGEPIRALGRDRIRITQGFPRGCLALALPGRIAAHIGGLPLALAVEGTSPEAILILPAYSQSDNLSCHSVVVQRVVLTPTLEHPARPGDSARSRGIALESGAWSRAAAAIVADLVDKVPVEPIASSVMAHQRIDIPRQMIVCQPRETGHVAQITACTRQIIAALAGGHIVRLNRDDCASRAEFLRELALALELLPAALRSHVSAAIGLTRPDAAFQIGWAPDITPVRLADDDISRAFEALAPDMTLAEAGSVLFRAPQSEGPEIARYNGDALHDGLIVSTRDDCGIMAELRGWIASHSLVASTQTGVREASHLGFVERLASLRRPGLIDGAVARSLLVDLNNGRVIQSPPTGAPDGGFMASAFALVTGRDNAPLDLEAAGLALDLAAYACDERDSKAKGEEMANRTKDEVYAFLTAAPMLSPETLAVIVGHARLADFVAGLIHARDERIVWRMRNVMAMAELLGVEGRELSMRAIQTLAPRDGRTYHEWSYRPADASDLQQVLAIIISDRPSGQNDLARDLRAIAQRLLQLDRRDLLVEALQSAAMAIGTAGAAVGSERFDADQRRLDVVSLLSAALLRDQNEKAAARGQQPGLHLYANA